MNQDSFGPNIFLAEDFWPGRIFGQDSFWMVMMIYSRADFRPDRFLDEQIFGQDDFLSRIFGQDVLWFPDYWLKRFSGQESS